jgi:hypothetical protein
MAGKQISSYSFKNNILGVQLKLIYSFQESIKQALNLTIFTTTFLLIWSLIYPTQLLLDFLINIPGWNDQLLYLSCMLPVDILAVFLALIIFIRQLNFQNSSTKSALSLLMFNVFSFFLMYKFFPLFYLDSSFKHFLYQLFLSMSGYISCVYGSLFIGRILLKK